MDKDIITIHFGINPINGGNPLRERRDSIKIKGIKIL
jgi:hypothetical protein